MNKNKQPIPDFSEVQVKLKPIFGIKPGIYLIGIYTVIILIVLFFLLLFPGISNNGTLLEIDTIPHKAVVRIDDEYIGSTPVIRFTKSGNRTIRITKPFYKDIVLDSKVDGALFGSLFFPLKNSIDKSLEIIDIDGLVSFAIADYAPLGMIKDFTFDYQLPQIMSETAEACYAINGKSSQVIEKLYGFLDNAMYFIDSEQELYDYSKALTTVSAKGGILSISSMIKLVSKIIHDKDTYENYPLWLMKALPRTLIKSDVKTIDKYGMYTKVEQSKWFTAFANKSLEKLSALPQPSIASSQGSVFINGSKYNLVPGGRYIMGDSTNVKSAAGLLAENTPHTVDIGKFYMSVSEVTNADFYDFTRANPEWLPSNVNALLEKKLVSATYLRGWKNDKPQDALSSLPVSEVSYYAASAYCAWLSKKAPSGLKVRLPYEAEWESIAKIDERNSQLPFPETPKQAPLPGTGTASAGFGLVNMYGNMWTWCEDWFYPAGYELYNPAAPYYTNPLLSGSEKSVRGGSWANVKSDGIRSYTRASLMPDSCTPYTGFRTVAADH